MDLIFSEEHEALRATIRQFLDDRSTEAAVREQMASERGYDPAVWTQLAEELGLVGLIIEEEHGGAGFGPVELMIALEEMGRALLCAPYFSTVVLASNAIIESGDAAAQEALLPGIAEGRSIATLAFSEDGRPWDLESIQATATRSGDGWVLDGTKTPVIDGHVADVLLVAARSDSGLSLFHLAGDAAGVERTALPPLDPTRKLARIELHGAQATLVGTEGSAQPVLRKVLDLAAAALAAEQVGAAQRCLDMAVDYAKERIQFGRPIGSFQGIKHRCADLLVEIEAAKSAAYNAGFTAAEGGEDLAIAASMAQSYCSETLFHAAAENIQIHGGIGFTWEHPAHLYFKRAESSKLLLGDPVFHRDRLARELKL